MSRAVRVDVRHHKGCPLVAAVLELVHSCVSELGVHADVATREAPGPSPTVLVDGRDVMDVTSQDRTADACRLDVPTRAQITDALTRASASRLDGVG